MTTWLERARIERTELAERIHKCQVAVDRNTVKGEQGNLLNLQLDAMSTYYRILDMRIHKAIFNTTFETIPEDKLLDGTVRPVVGQYYKLQGNLIRCIENPTHQCVECWIKQAGLYCTNMKCNNNMLFVLIKEA